MESIIQYYGTVSLGGTYNAISSTPKMLETSHSNHCTRQVAQKEEAQKEEAQLPN